jgi:hypothetical protein
VGNAVVAGERTNISCNTTRSTADLWRLLAAGVEIYVKWCFLHAKVAGDNH